jgi:hypothetical protein
VRAPLLVGAARRPLLLVTALYAIAAVVSALPAVLHFRSEFLSTGLPGYGEAATGDHSQTMYRFWLFGHQLEHGRAPWIDPYSYQPLVEPQVVLGGWPFGVPFWPLEALFGPVVAWNMLLLGVTVAAGLLVYLWLAELGLPPAAAALGGLAFAIAPYRLVQTGGHLLGWVAVLLPLALWAFERSRGAATTRAGHAWGALGTAGVVSIPLSGQLHLALGAVPLLVAYGLVRYARVPALWLLGGALAAVGIGLWAQASLLSGTAASGGRTLAEVALYSAHPLDFASRSRRDGLEEFVYLGWLTPALAIAGAPLLGRRRLGLAVVLALAALVPSLLALGANLPLYETLHDHFPPLRYPRVPGRFLPLADLALAALAGVAAASVLDRVRRGRRTAVAVLLLALVAADLLVFPLRASPADPGNAAYAALARAGPGRVLELPVFQRGMGQFASVYLYYTLQAPRERPTGYALAPLETFAFTARFNRLDCGVWLPGDQDALARLGIRYLVFHAGLYRQSATAGAWFSWEGLQRAGYGPAAHGGVLWLFERGASPAPPPVPEPSREEPILCDGWRNGALAQTEGAAWLYGSGRARLELEAAAPTRVVVFADGRRLPARTVVGRVTVGAEVGREGWHALVVRGRSGLRLLSVGLR